MSNFFQGRGWSNCLLPIETHITCDFPGGDPDPLSPPPLDPHLKTSVTTQATVNSEIHANMSVKRHICDVKICDLGK